MIGSQRVSHKEDLRVHVSLIQSIHLTGWKEEEEEEEIEFERVFFFFFFFFFVFCFFYFFFCVYYYYYYYFIDFWVINLWVSVSFFIISTLHHHHHHHPAFTCSSLPPLSLSLSLSLCSLCSSAIKAPSSTTTWRPTLFLTVLDQNGRKQPCAFLFFSHHWPLWL